LTNLGEGGSLSGDQAAAARIQAQYPPPPVGDFTVTDSEAFAYISRLAQLFPGLNEAMSALKEAGTCAINYGVIGAKLYVTPDFQEAGAIVVVSAGQAQQLPAIAAKCALNRVLGGGPSGGFNPCFESYEIRDRVNNVDDNYYILVAGTNQAWCDYVMQGHANYRV
jgi:hypothetical protein